MPRATCFKKRDLDCLVFKVRRERGQGNKDILWTSFAIANVDPTVRGYPSPIPICTRCFSQSLETLAARFAATSSVFGV